MGGFACTGAVVLLVCSIEEVAGDKHTIQMKKRPFSFLFVCLLASSLLLGHRAAQGQPGYPPSLPINWKVERRAGMIKRYLSPDLISKQPNRQLATS